MKALLKRCYLWIKFEIGRIFPVFVFFFVAFNLINWMDSFLLKQSGFQPFSLVTITVSAALVAKIFLAINHMPIDAPVKKKPLIYVIIWKTGIYWLITLVIKLAVKIFPYFFLDEGFMGGIEAFCKAFNWRFFATVQTWYLMLLFIYVVSHELSLVIGKEKLRRIFFGKH